MSNIFEKGKKNEQMKGGCFRGKDTWNIDGDKSQNDLLRVKTLIFKDYKYATNTCFHAFSGFFNDII